MRPPVKWWEPKGGPFVVLGLHSVPGDPYPISPLQAVMEQFEELQAHIAAAAAEAGTFKSFVAVEATNAWAPSARAASAKRK